MKTIFLTVLATLGWLFSFAQEPDVGGSIILGTGVGDNLPASPFAPAEAVSFTIDAGSSVGTMNWPPPGGSEFQVNITVRGMGYPVVTVEPGFTNYFATPEIIDVGGGAYFISLLQDKTIPGGEYTVFRISGTATGPNSTTVGYQANGNPGGYNTTNVGTDDPSSFGSIDTSLPVTLTEFNAAREEATTRLTWATTQETNSDYFELQHSRDAKAWRTLTIVKSSGESSVLRNYGYTHTTPAGGLNYYRLKMVDQDATFAYSAIRSVNFEGAAGILPYPNPAVSRIQLKNLDIGQVDRVLVQDPSGRVVINQNAVTSEGLDITKLPAGLYVVTVKLNNGAVTNHKVTVSR
jgi:hypothetical protein